MEQDTKITTASTGRPFQRLSWSEKMANDKEWFNKNADYYLSTSQFNGNSSAQMGNHQSLSELYGVYNNQFPMDWFSHITNPLSARDPKHKVFPAKVRPVSMLRTNIDLLLGEYPRRPFVYQVVNMGEDGYNSYLDQLTKGVQANLTQHFVKSFQMQAQAQGMPVDKIPGPDQIPLPDQYKESFTESYKDAQAIRGQKWLRRAVREYNIRSRHLEMFKDWLITGQAYSYKGIDHDTLIYERVSPLEFDYARSESTRDVEDSEWQIRRRTMSLADVASKFYDILTEDDWRKLESTSAYQSPMAFYTYLTERYNTYRRGEIPVYHICWKGYKKIGMLSYPDMLTGQTQTTTVDEDYIINKEAGESVKWMWVGEGYECWRLGNDIYLGQGAIKVQRSQMNNLSALKLPYNGRSYSNTHAPSISPLQIGLPFQLMYMIVNRTLELTIAKSKGKITMIDKNAIPNTDGWNDEKFFYYAEALGYMIVNRNQIGVDKSWNQYHVLDMSLFDQIKELIALQEHYKQQWDDALGINRPRKGETYASDGKAVSQMALFQSSVITDMIFVGFEEFCEKELQGLLDYSRLINATGVRKIYNNDDFDTELLDIDPNTYCSAELGVFVSYSPEEMENLRQVKAQIQPMLQNGAKPSTIVEIIYSQNIAELRAKLKVLEAAEAEQAQENAQNQQEAETALEQVKENYLRLEYDLKEHLEGVIWDRKDQNSLIQGEYNLHARADEKMGEAEIPSVESINDRILKQQEIFQKAEAERNKQSGENMRQDKDLQSAQKDRESKEKIAKLQANTALKNKVSGQK